MKYFFNYRWLFFKLDKSSYEFIKDLSNVMEIQFPTKTTMSLNLQGQELYELTEEITNEFKRFLQGQELYELFLQGQELYELTEEITNEFKRLF